MSNNSPIQPKLLSKINERLVLRMIRDKGPLTRAELSDYIGVTFPTVTKAVSSLLESNFLEEVEDISTGRGRPAKRLQLACENSQIVGVILGRTECAVVTGGLNGQVQADNILCFPTPATYDSLLISVTSHVRRHMLRGDMATLGVGISVPAIVDYREQRVVLSSNFPLISGKCIGRDLQSLLGHECVLMRDSHAVALSEHINGKAKEESNFAVLDLCAGVGLGLMVDGRFLIGGSGYAGELGHIPVVPDGDLCQCGKKGCLETVASEWALEARVSQLLGRSVEFDEILRLVRDGDSQCRVEVERMCAYLAVGVANVVNIVNPEAFYIKGRLFATCPDLLDVLIKETKQLALGPAFARCKFDHASGELSGGTIAVIINYLTESLVPNLDGYVNVPGSRMYECNRL